MGQATRLLVLSAIAWSAPARAHPGFEADLVRLSAAIDEAPTAQLYLQRAEKLRLVQRYDEAVRDLSRAEALGASPVEAALLRGLTLADQGNQPAALVELDRHFARGGASVLGLRTRARLNGAQGRRDAAVEDLTRAVRQGADPEVCLELSDAEEARGRTEDAAQGLERCLTALNGAVTVRKRLIEVRLRQRDFTRAVALARAGMEGLAVKAEWRLLAADALDAGGQKADARAERELALLELERVLAHRGGGLHQLLRARALVGLGRKSEARALLDALLVARPDFDEARGLRAALSSKRAKGRNP